MKVIETNHEITKVVTKRSFGLQLMCDIHKIEACKYIVYCVGYINFHGVKKKQDKKMDWNIISPVEIKICKSYNESLISIDKLMCTNPANREKILALKGINIETSESRIFKKKIQLKKQFEQNIA